MSKTTKAIAIGDVFGPFTVVGIMPIGNESFGWDYTVHRIDANGLLTANVVSREDLLAHA